MREIKRYAMIAAMLVVAVGLLGCGGSDGGGSSAKQYTLDVSADMAVIPSGGGGSSIKDIPTPQVMIGATLVEVTNNTQEELGIKMMNFDLGPELTVEPEIRIVLTPGVEPLGIIYKLCDILKIPLGTSYINLDLAASSTSTEVEFISGTGTSVLEDGKLHLGQFQVLAEADDRSRLPLLSEIPVINFLFQGQQHQAELDNLIILLTPQILQDTE